MNITMNNVRIESIEDIIKLLQAPDEITLTNTSREARYACIVEVLVGVKYRTLRKKEKGVVKDFLVLVTGYADRHVKRLVRKWRGKG
jgi:hypothetical protein